jgi:ATP-dependent helicase/nuclease subunit B
VAARPRQLSVTQVGTLMRDPYAFYARKVLRLSALEPLDAPLGPRERGTIVHGALDAFIKEFPAGPLPPDALARLLAHGNDAFVDVFDNDEVRAFWWPRIERLAAWFVGVEGARRGEIERAYTECDGRVELAAPAGPVTLTGRADRIDRLADGTLAIIDYKTGSVPGAGAVAAGFEPQLPLEAAMARAGGFADPLLTAEASKLFYWRVAGGRVPGEIKDAVAGRKVASSLEQIVDGAVNGLAALLAHFDDPQSAYPATPRPAYALTYNDYAHLARQKEWLTAEEDAGE